jgi:hypothetical protein
VRGLRGNRALPKTKHLKNGCEILGRVSVERIAARIALATGSGKDECGRASAAYKPLREDGETRNHKHRGDRQRNNEAPPYLLRICGHLVRCVPRQRKADPPVGGDGDHEWRQCVLEPTQGAAATHVQAVRDLECDRNQQQ